MTSQVSPVPTLPRFQREHTGYPSIKNSKVPPAGFEPDSASGSSARYLGQNDICSLAESMPSGVVLPPEVWERLPESLRASLTARIRESERGDAM